MGAYKKPCVRCLLREVDAGEEYEGLKRYLDSFEKDIRVTEAEYERRLAICRECNYLIDGICGKCGCFVEARALRRLGACPHEESHW